MGICRVRQGASRPTTIPDCRSTPGGRTAQRTIRALPGRAWRAGRGAALNDTLVRELPASQEAEGIILGSIILDDAHCDEATQSLSPSDFSLEANRRIYRAMRDLRQQNKLIE